MRHLGNILVFIGLLFGSSTLRAQISNFLLNGSSTTFTMTTGDTIQWTCNIPTGATVNGELWYDVNQNGTVEQATDLIYYIFTQTDGDTSRSGGPPDLDGAVDGHLFFMSAVGLAPGKYIFKLTNNATTVTVTGTVNPMASPAHTISGHVTPPPGKSAQYILVNLQRGGQGSNTFWDGTTDASGNYSIGMNTDTSGNPWRLRIDNNPFPPAVVTPEETMLTITGNHSGYDFTFLVAAAQVAGFIRDENDLPRTDARASIRRNDTTNFYRHSNAGVNGFFQIGILANELSPKPWFLEGEMNNNGPTTTSLQPHVEIPTIGVGDSLFRILKVYQTNSTIRGSVTINHVPVNWPMQVVALNRDTALATAILDSITGNFTVPVSDKIADYEMTINWIPPNWRVPLVIAHAGDSTVILNISAQTNVQIQYHPSWNMLSVPLLVPDYHKTILFPFSQSPAYNFFAGGYKTDSILLNGAAYWLKYPNYNATWIYGYPYSQDTISVQAGWNMIGPTTDGIQITSIVPNGTTIVRPFYGYATNGYYSAATLYPGAGYWVKVNQAGTLVFNQSPAAWRILQAPDDEAGISPTFLQNEPGISQLRFKDGSGQERALYFSSTRSDLISDAYELPPLPPSGIFDVRYSSQRMFESAKGNPESLLPIVISSAEYPVTLAWTLSEQNSGASIVLDGSTHSLRKNGELQIREYAHIGLRLESAAAAPAPKEFALYTNYPNPFNPSTLIKYDIASRTHVQLSVFNVLGQQTTTLVDEIQDAARYTKGFTPTNLPGGVYYYTITAGSFSKVGKMIYMK